MGSDTLQTSSAFNDLIKPNKALKNLFNLLAEDHKMVEIVEQKYPQKSFDNPFFTVSPMVKRERGEAITKK